MSLETLLPEPPSINGSLHPNPPRKGTPAIVPGVRRVQRDLWFVRWILTLAALGSLTLLIVIPLVHVFCQALAHGLRAYWENLAGNAETVHSILLR